MISVSNLTPAQRQRFYQEVFCPDCGAKKGKPCGRWYKNAGFVKAPKAHSSRKESAKRNVDLFDRSTMKKYKEL